MPTLRASATCLSIDAAHHDRAARLVHRMQVEQEVGRIDERLQFARAAQFGRVARTEQHVVGPHAVVVLVDVARRIRIVEVEARIGLDVGEGDDQPAARRPQVRAQQVVERQRAAELVAVRQRLQHHRRPGTPRVDTCT
jgi:hypothetical protein